MGCWGASLGQKRRGHTPLVSSQPSTGGPLTGVILARDTAESTIPPRPPRLRQTGQLLVPACKSPEGCSGVRGARGIIVADRGCFWTVSRMPSAAGRGPFPNQPPPPSLWPHQLAPGAAPSSTGKGRTQPRWPQSPLHTHCNFPERDVLPFLKCLASAIHVCLCD